MLNTKISIPSVTENASPEIIDLLATSPSTSSFADRVRALGLSLPLEEKVLCLGCIPGEGSPSGKQNTLTVSDEQELATEVLRYRHLFTQTLLGYPLFRQAALSIIQNIYLFKNRKIFFGTTVESVEQERQEALLLFSSIPYETSLPVAKTFQHLIIARIWRRIISRIPTDPKQWDPQIAILHDVVEKLNTLRNIYMLLCSGLVTRLVQRASAIYKRTLSWEDMVQIGGIGIARAAYRYHQSCGLRFSTFASNWVFREIQRQALAGRLIRISTNTVAGYSKAARARDTETLTRFSTIIQKATTLEWDAREGNEPSESAFSAASSKSPAVMLEASELKDVLLQAIDQVLSEKHGDIIKRRYGLGPYKGKEQSIISISKTYGVTRSSIYQLEEAALKKLQRRLRFLYRLPPTDAAGHSLGFEKAR